MKNLPGDVKEEVLLIAPSLAARMLEGNTNNRILSEAYALRLAREMRSGAWLYNGVPIIVNGNGRILDGQHRLRAIVLSRTTQPMKVLSNASDELLTTVDVNRRRTSADWLRMKYGITECNSVAAALNLIFKYQNGNLYNRKQGATTHEIDLLYQAYPEMEEYVKSNRTSHRRSLISQSVLSFMDFATHKDSPTLADGFMSKLRTGAGLKKSEPVYALREYLIRLAISEVRIRRSRLLGLLMLAWTMAKEGKSVRGELKLGTEYPVVTFKGLKKIK